MRAACALAVASAVALAVAPAACGDVDPCEAITGTCVAVHVDVAGAHELGRLDQLELGVQYGERHDVTTTRPAGGAGFALPAAAAIALDVAPAQPVFVSVVVAGMRGGAVLGTGAASTALLGGGRASLAIELAPPASCTPGELRCGGDGLAGDRDTVYTCNPDGVPRVRGRCAFGCMTDVGGAGVCRGGGGRCVEGGFYCGGDKLDGDPQTLYRCQNGVATAGQPCADGCVVAPAGSDDYCR